MVFLAAMTAPAVTLAQDEVAESYARTGGQLNAYAEWCGSLSKTELASRKKEQAQGTAKRGLSVAQFEAAFNDGYEAAKMTTDAATPGQRADVCDKLNSGKMKP